MDQQTTSDNLKKPDWLYFLQSNVPSPGPGRANSAWAGVLGCCVGLLIPVNLGDSSDYLSRTSTTWVLVIGIAAAVCGWVLTWHGIGPSNEALFRQLLAERARSDSYARKWSRDQLATMQTWIEKAQEDAEALCESVKRKREGNLISRRIFKSEMGGVYGPPPVYEPSDRYLAYLIEEVKIRLYEEQENHRKAGKSAEEAAALQLEMSIIQVDTLERSVLPNELVEAIDKAQDAVDAEAQRHEDGWRDICDMLRNVAGRAFRLANSAAYAVPKESKVKVWQASWNASWNEAKKCYREAVRQSKNYDRVRYRQLLYADQTLNTLNGLQENVAKLQENAAEDFLLDFKKNVELHDRDVHAQRAVMDEAVTALRQLLV